MRSQLLHLLLYSALVAVFFGLLSHRSVRDKVRLAAILWAAMVAGTLLLAFAMYMFPS